MNVLMDSSSGLSMKSRLEYRFDPSKALERTLCERGYLIISLFRHIKTDVNNLDVGLHGNERGRKIAIHFQENRLDFSSSVGSFAGGMQWE